MQNTQKNLAVIRGGYLSELRKDIGLTQQQIADNLHLSKSSISHFEQGIAIPTTLTLIALADYFDVNVDYILGRCKSNIIKAQQSRGYEQWAKVFNLKLATNTLNFLAENGIDTYPDLQAKHREILDEFSKVGDKLKELEARIRSTKLVIINLKDYYRLKPVQMTYSKAGNKAEYREKHSAELIIFEAAKSTLATIYKDKKLPSLKELQTEQRVLMNEQQRLYSERSIVAKRIREIGILRENVDRLISHGNKICEDVIERVMKNSMCNSGFAGKLIKLNL